MTAHVQPIGIRLLLWLGIIGLSLSACQTTNSLSESAELARINTAWGASTAWSADYAFSPALVWRDSATAPLLAWGASDVEGVMRHYMAPAGSTPRILALDARLPLQHQLYPASPDLYHLLWLDLSPERDGLRLYHAIVGQDLVAKVGTNNLSNQATAAYHALALDDGRLLVAWTQGRLGAQTLHLTTIDAQGRVYFAERVARSAEQPALLRLPDDSLRLLWQAEGVIWQAELFPNQETWRWTPPEIYAPLPQRVRHSELNAFYAASDSTHRYLIWQFTPVDGEAYVMWTSAEHADPSAPAPQRLSYLTDSSSYQTGYNGGTANTAREGTDDANRYLVTWARPLIGRHPAALLALAIQDNRSALSLLWLTQGKLVAQQLIANEARLGDAPRLVSSLDGQRHLALAWSDVLQPRAQLRVTDSQP